MMMFRREQNSKRFVPQKCQPGIRTTMSDADRLYGNSTCRRKSKERKLKIRKSEDKKIERGVDRSQGHGVGEFKARPTSSAMINPHQGRGDQPVSLH
jgi:hypothetical protein